MNFFLSVPLSSFDEMFDNVVSAGFRPEVRMTRADRLAKTTRSELAGMRERIERRSMTTFTHGPFFGLDIASLDVCLSEYSADCLKIGLEATAALGGSVMVMHTGYLPQFSRGGRRYWLRNWAERMPKIVEHAVKLGVTLALENTWDDRPEIMLRLAEMLPGDNVRFCLDTGHVNAFSHLGIGRWWDMIGDRVVALHLHDNDGLSDDHLAPGEGTFDFEALAGRLRGLDALPLLDLETDLARGARGREYLEALLAAGTRTPR
jgi:sugar phosphate isomerase/epimerase